MYYNDIMYALTVCHDRLVGICSSVCLFFITTILYANVSIFFHLSSNNNNICVYFEGILSNGCNNLQSYSAAIVRVKNAFLAIRDINPFRKYNETITGFIVNKFQ